MFLIRLLMTLFFNRQYVLLYQDGETAQVLRVVRKTDWFATPWYGGTIHRLHPGGMVTEEGNTVGAWLPLTIPMHAVYNKR